jgi:hypothetical protein
MGVSIQFLKKSHSVFENKNTFFISKNAPSVEKPKPST